ncbi:MAG: dTDP-4-dehydrorhamnose reductase [Acidobacteriia bacterium]|nr:dTDP-4-dehydrorhamnose reductase [Terriglobia bacterium]
MRITIFGATGLLGKALMREWKDDEVTGLGSADGDIRDAKQVLTLVRDSRPDWIVLAAAYTDVDGCETNRDLAFDVNCRGAVNVARAAKQQGTRLLFLSTDYVFDGTKTTPYATDDPRAPRSVYGQSKAEAEVQLGETLPECCIVRISWLFGAGGKCFPATILKLAASRPELEVVGDQRGSPTYSIDLAHAIVQLCRQGASGIVHVTNRGECSWYEFAREIIARAGLKTVVRETTSAKFVRPAERPKYSVLSPESLQKRGIAMPDWRDALTRYLLQRT